jgi:hypothetical protein
VRKENLKNREKNMKLTNYDGTEASEKAYNIHESIETIRDGTLPWLKENSLNLDSEQLLSRIKALKNYINKLQHDLGVELGNDKAWENV